MEACALDGRPITLSGGQKFVPVQKHGKGENAAREMFGVITNLSRPAEGNYIYRLLCCVFIFFLMLELSFY
jgi:hypothetical protein